MNFVTFDFNDSPVRSVTIGGEPWFVGKDVCRCLDIQNNRDAIARLADDERGSAVMDTLGGQQTMTTVNEPVSNLKPIISDGSSDHGGARRYALAALMKGAIQ